MLFLFLFLVYLPLLYGETDVFYKIEGRLILSLEYESKDIFKDVEISLLNSNRIGFVKEDGSFVVNKVLPGFYILEATHPDVTFESVRVDVSKSGKIRARRVNLIQPNLVTALPYPLKIKSLFKTPYFQIREKMQITSFLLNPMVLMMILPLIVIVVMPKLMSSMDIDPQKELAQNKQFEKPDISEMMTNAIMALTGKSSNKAQSDKSLSRQNYDGPSTSQSQRGKRRRDN